MAKTNNVVGWYRRLSRLGVFWGTAAVLGIIVVGYTFGCNSKPASPSSFTNSIGMRFVLIPAGKFTMGSKEGEPEEPMHKVRIAKAFYMAQTELTQGQWEAVMGSRPWAGRTFAGVQLFNSGPEYPAVYVDWENAQAFCRRLSRMEGKLYRLPSEAEWEYAARAGGEGKWCFGSDEASIGEFAWYSNNTKVINGEFTHRVGTKRANAFGLHDMHGNVSEWCEDTWHPDYKDAPTDGSPWIGPDMTRRVERGGDSNSDAWWTRSAYRSGRWPTDDSSYRGFRVVCGDKQ